MSKSDLQVTKFQSNNYSTIPVEPSYSQSRSYISQRRQDPEKEKPKAFNMNDSQRRIKRDFTVLFKQSNDQSALFQKGVKKITPTIKEDQRARSSKRRYHNNQSYDLLKPTPLKTQQGVRKIFLYDQNKESNPYQRCGSQSRKKLIRDHNKESESAGCMAYFVQKLPTHKNDTTQWHHKVAVVELKKKQNLRNLENRDKQVVQIKRSFKGNKNNEKNNSQLTVGEGGLTLRGENLTMDFTQEYFKKQQKVDNGGRRQEGGWHSSRLV